MGLELRQQARLELKQNMTLQLQQAIKLLQLTRFELQSAISQELMENPVLEEVVSGRAAEPVAPVPQSAASPDSRDGDGMPASDEPLSEGSTSAQGSEGEFAWGRYLDSYAGGRPEGAFGRAEPEDGPREDRRFSSHTDLKDHLMWQLRLSDMSAEERDIGVFVIGNLDEDGLLAPDNAEEDVVETVAAATGATREAVEAVLGRIRMFDPVGVASRDIRECLRVQAEYFDPGNDVIRGILGDHYDLFQGMKFQQLARVLKVEEDDVRDAVRIISKFETRPGRNFSSEEPQFIMPDLYVEKVGGEYRVISNDEGIPRLRVNRFYRDYLRNKGRDEATKYIKEKLNSAVWFINSIEQRQRTMHKVMEAILRMQRPFFDKGPEQLKPLCLRDIAQEIGMHESTVCRVTNNKYVHTPQGIFELKYFFSGGLDTAEGVDVATTAVKSRIHRLLQDEATRSLSDREIVAILARDGVKLARRTVAKYRTQLGIMPSSKRKKKL
ncbi:MAG: RNA polymerase factor sigma-54 [Myxococcota bacterium]|jgi:RNA polymerase sigma-54 factor